MFYTFYHTKIHLTVKMCNERMRHRTPWWLYSLPPLCFQEEWYQYIWIQCYAAVYSGHRMSYTTTNIQYRHTMEFFQPSICCSNFSLQQWQHAWEHTLWFVVFWYRYIFSVYPLFPSFAWRLSKTALAGKATLADMVMYHIRLQDVIK